MNERHAFSFLPIHWKQGLVTAALAGLTSLFPVHAQSAPESLRSPQLTHQQFEAELAKADAEYERTGSAQPYKNLHQKLVDTWDLKDEGYAKLIFQVMDRSEMAKREHPIRNGTLGQIYHGERNIVPRF